MKTILLKFSGPLQSWGTSSRFETRFTDLYPSKSAIIGLLAASLGYRREETNAIQRLNELDFVVRVEQQGKLIRDFHIAKKYKNGKFERNYVTNRYYLSDAIFLVALTHSDEEWMDEIEYALLHPYFQPFMGRRALPLPLDFFVGTFTESGVDVLSTFPWQASEFIQMSQSNDEVILELYADAHLLPERSNYIRQDKVVSFDQKERKFGFRYESRIDIPLKVPIYLEEHDILKEVGEN